MYKVHILIIISFIFNIEASRKLNQNLFPDDSQIPSDKAPELAACSCLISPGEKQVCGVDGKTYGNRCGAKCANVKIKHEGPCPEKPKPSPKPCVCTKEYKPVCGVDGKTYGNRCMADCANVDIISEGECPEKPKPSPEPCVCTKEYRPVCGVDGKTYGNPCGAKCANIKIKHEGPCPKKPKPSPKPCVCTKEYRPVCGVDGKTYGNPCMADCANVKRACYGECPCSGGKPKNPDLPPKKNCKILCKVDPCVHATCSGFPYANCRSECCQAKFYLFGREVDCGYEKYSLRKIDFP